jgi:NAD-dependent SIR2 family protein deacetylase
MNMAAIKEAAELIHQSTSILITAGAGVGVDSGLPDFRGDEGFWRAYPPFAQLGLSFADVANPAWFRRDPALAWGFYGHRMHLYRDTVPHAGFDILRAFAALKERSFVFTSNVDGQFQKSGFGADQIVEVHGSIHHAQCLARCGRGISQAEFDVSVDATTFRAREPLPRCDCGALLRPNVLMFGDGDWDSDRSDQQMDRFDSFLAVAAASANQIVVIEVGAGTTIPTVRRLGETLVERARARLIRINARESSTPIGQIGLAMGALEAIQAIENAHASLS